MAEKRGKLIVFEGTDFSGKSTQIKLLIEKLKKEGISSLTIHFPNYQTPTGKVVKRYLDSEFGSANSIDPRIASILYAEDRFASKPAIEDALKKFDVVILDRYVESNMGHQGGKIKDKVEREKFFKWLEEIEYGTFSLPKPDAILFLHMPCIVGMELKKERAGKEDGHESDIEHLKNAEKSYLHLVNLYSWIKISCAPDDTLTSLRTSEDISEEVYSKVKDIISN
jgi:dTMP kinase